MDQPQQGRPSKVSPELAKRIAALLEQGIPERQAAEASGLDAASFFNYINAGKAGDPAYAEFYAIIEQAKETRKTWRRHAKGTP